MNIGKVLLLSFDGDEEKVIDSVISSLRTLVERNLHFNKCISNSEVTSQGI